MYQVISVGNNKLHIEGVISDSEGENISHLNNKYCELTALYWMWKNSDEDIVGLNHYRRYFDSNGEVLNKIKADELMQQYDIVVAKPRNYLIFNIRSHYKNAHKDSDLKILESILKEKNPDYIDSFNEVMNGSKLSLYNMFLTRKIILNEYCSFLFPLLEELDLNIDTTSYNSYQKRVIGFLAERIFNVWLVKNKGKYKIGYLKVKNAEGEPLFKKGVALLKRQLF